MRVTSRPLQIAAVSAVLAFTGAPPALANPQASSGQQTQQGGKVSQGPLVLTPIESTFVIAPVAKVTEIAGVTSGLAGFYAGKVLDNKLFVGGSAFWLANPTNNTRLWYGGAVVGWTCMVSGPFSVRATTLVGAGQASRLLSIGVFPTEPFMHGFHGNNRVRFRDDFVIAEPELTLQVKLLDRLRLNFGAGYRYTTRVFGLGDQLRGATGSLGLEFRFGK
jgi:hypothetical protein